MFENVLDTPSRRLSLAFIIAALALCCYFLLIDRGAVWLLVIAVLLALVGIFGPMTSLWDRFGPDIAFPMFRKRDVGSVERYFQLWLTQFGREQALFATMANENNVATQYVDESGILFDSIDDVVEQYERFVLIGEPGVGKTAIVEGLAQAITEGSIARAMPALMGEYAGVKWVNAHPQNRARHGLPTVMGTYVLSCPRTGVPLAIMDATLLTALRTGAAAAVASKHLAKLPLSRVGFIVRP